MQTSLVAAQLWPTLDVPDLLRHADLVIRGQPHRGGRAAPQAGAHLRLAVREKVRGGKGAGQIHRWRCPNPPHAVPHKSRAFSTVATRPPPRSSGQPARKWWRRVVAREGCYHFRIRISPSSLLSCLQVWAPSGGENGLQDVAAGVQEGGRDPNHR